MLEVIQLALNYIQKDTDDKWVKAHNFNEIARFYIGINLREQAIPILDQALHFGKQIKEIEERDIFLAELGADYASVRLDKQALDIALQIEDEWQRDSRLYPYLTLNYIELGKHNKIQEFLSFVKNNEYVLINIAEQYTDSGYLTQALSIIDRMSNDCNRAVALAYLSNKYVEKNKQKEVLDILDKAVESIKTTNDPSFKSLTLGNIARAYINLGRKDIAQEILSQAQIKINNTKDFLLQPIISNAFGYELIAAGEYDQAIQYIESNSKTIAISEQIKMLLKIASGYQKSGKQEQVNIIINQVISIIPNISADGAWLDTKTLQSFALLDIGRQLLEFKQYDKTLEIVEKIPIDEYKITLLTNISTAYIKNKEPKEKSLEILDRAWLMSQNTNYQNFLVIIVSIVDQYSKLGNYKKALEIIKKTPDSYIKVNSLINMAKIYSKSESIIDQETIKYIQKIN